MGTKRITNVAPGIANADAVNMGQLQAVNTALDSKHQPKLPKLPTRVVAAAIAMESAPVCRWQLTYAAGVGHFEGQSALGLACAAPQRVDVGVFRAVFRVARFGEQRCALDLGVFD